MAYNSQDLFSIEIIWLIIKQMFIFFPPKDMNTYNNDLGFYN